jgi:hypothetical protein
VTPAWVCQKVRTFFIFFYVSDWVMQCSSVYGGVAVGVLYLGGWVFWAVDK